MADWIEIVYSFKAEDGGSAEFVVRLAVRTLALEVPLQAPPWARLNHQQCADCPLAADETAWCPMAQALAAPLAFAGQLVSHSALQMTVLTPEREIRAKTTAQRGLSSLMGLIMATCACPDVAWLRPMARFHLPLANEEETIYRAASMYLLAEYFRRQRGAAPDLALAGLRDRYRRLHDINVAMAERLRGAAAKDAPVNAVVLLDLFAKTMPYSVAECLGELEYLFQPYLSDLDPA